MIDEHPELLILLVPALWFGLISLIGAFGGWGSLAREYRAWDAFEGRTWRFQSVKLGQANYGGCVSVGAGERGLYLSLLFPFRPGHPPLLIPWEEISASQGTFLFARYVDLRFVRVPSLRLRLSEALAGKLQQAMGARWPGRRSELRPIEPR